METLTICVGIGGYIFGLFVQTRLMAAGRAKGESVMWRSFKSGSIAFLVSVAIMTSYLLIAGLVWRFAE